MSKLSSKVTIAVDLAKDVFEIAVANAAWKVIERRRLTRAQFERFWQSREPCRVVMEACSGAHHWARMLIRLGFQVDPLPPHQVRPYRTRNKTDRTDCDALLEAARSPRIEPVAVKSEDQQAILALHRAREQWKDTRTMRINGMRGLLREFGIPAPKGAQKFLVHLPQLLEQHRGALPERVRRIVLAFWEEVQALEQRMEEIEQELQGIAREHEVMRSLLEIPGIGVLTATALYASVGNVHNFKSPRHLASWLGITPREYSSGGKRRLGRISKQGDPYLRTLLIHGARSALTAAQLRQKRGQPLTHLQQWALKKEKELRHSNQAAVALACRPVHAQRAAPQAGENLLGALEARAALRWQLPAAAASAGAGGVSTHRQARAQEHPGRVFHTLLRGAAPKGSPRSAWKTRAPSCASSSAASSAK